MRAYGREMRAQHCVIETPVPRAWVWAALTDVSAIADWSGFDRCLHDGPERLDASSEHRCTLRFGDRSIGATLSVFTATEPEQLCLRTEAAVATVFETITLTRKDPRCTLVDYSLDAMSPLPGPPLQAWITSQVGVVRGGLEDYFGTTGTQAAAD